MAELAEEEQRFPKEKKGLLKCNGSYVDSEIIYWKIVPGDRSFESPITPHHADHHDKYLSFEYDAGGWNNVRMGMECLLVVAHAMGRTLVVPPQQHLYLLGVNHQDKGDQAPHDEMGFEDFFDLDLLRSHEGLHIMHMEEFLAKEGVSGGLKGVLPPHNSSEAWGNALWQYLKKVRSLKITLSFVCFCLNLASHLASASCFCICMFHVLISSKIHFFGQVADVQPRWQGKFVAFPAHTGDFDFSHADTKSNTSLQERMKSFGGERSAVYYDQALQQAHHMHFPADSEFRLLQHHYGETLLLMFFLVLTFFVMSLKDESI